MSTETGVRIKYVFKYHLKEVLDAVIIILMMMMTIIIIILIIIIIIIIIIRNICIAPYSAR